MTGVDGGEERDSYYTYYVHQCIGHAFQSKLLDGGAFSFTGFSPT